MKLRHAIILSSMLYATHVFANDHFAAEPFALGTDDGTLVDSNVTHYFAYFDKTPTRLYISPDIAPHIQHAEHQFHYNAFVNYQGVAFPVDGLGDMDTTNQSTLPLQHDKTGWYVLLPAAYAASPNQNRHKLAALKKALTATIVAADEEGKKYYAEANRCINKGEKSCVTYRYDKNILTFTLNDGQAVRIEVSHPVGGD